MSYSRERAVAYTRPRNAQLSDSVASYVRDLIMSGEVKGGEYLRVERIASDMEVSVTPVREAMAVLRGEGFIAQEPRRGFVVVPLRARDVQDLFDEQALISGELAARAAAALSEDKIAQLIRLQERLEEASRQHEPDDVERLNFEFHRLINRASDSRKLEWILRTIVRYSPRRFFPTIEGWDEASVADHHAIIDALGASDAEAARVSMVSHVRQAGNLLTSYLEKRGTFTNG
jgi:DNA-binding GntR family transcriptional regulator